MRNRIKFRLGLFALATRTSLYYLDQLARLWRRALTVKPIAGGAPEGDDDGKGGKGGEGEPEPTPTPAPTGDDEKVEKSKLDAAERAAAEANKRAREAERELKKAEDKKAEDEGKWRELAEEREKERDEAKAEAVKAKLESNVAKVAKRLGFADTDDAIRNLDSEVDADDEKAIERELNDVLKAKPHLKGDPKKPGSRPTRTRKASPGKSMDDLIRGRRR